VRGVLDEPRHVPDHVPGVPVLAALAVHPELELKRVRVGDLVGRHQHRADRREAVERLPGGTVFITANRDVHHARVAEHVIHRVAGGHVARGLADDDAQLDLVVRASVGERQPDGGVGADHRRRRFEEQPVFFDGVQLVLRL